MAALGCLVLLHFLIILSAGNCTEQNEKDSAQPTSEYSIADEETAFYLSEIFDKYGSEGKLTLEGFEHLMENLGLGHLSIDDHDLRDHFDDIGGFQDLHSDHDHHNHPNHHHDHHHHPNHVGDEDHDNRIAEGAADSADGENHEHFDLDYHSESGRDKRALSHLEVHHNHDHNRVSVGFLFLFAHDIDCSLKIIIMFSSVPVC